MASAQDAVRPASESENAAEQPYRSPTELKRLPLEALVDVEITSASRRPEPLFRSSSAVDVITGDDIERAGVMNIPDALRLGTEMQVAQVDGHTWAISARGFNISMANKMQVLMDGRSLYTPLFSGVFWDVQQTFLADLQQIEIIRGPGATLWGANAVNGVINIITKSAKDTQGFLVEGGGGDELKGFGGIRYGGTMGSDTYYRAYVMHQSYDSLELEGGGDAQDGTDFTQGGFRIDSLHANDTLTLQGDAYGGDFGQLIAPDIEVNGQNIIGRWTHQFDTDSSLMLQAYFDRTHRLIPDVFEEDRDTFDIEAQRRFVIGRHDVLVGGNYRLSRDDIGNLGPTQAFLPDQKTLHLVSGYVQDEWHIVPDKFFLTAGSKFEYNSFSGFEYQPSGRFTWNPTENQTVWGAVSRAVRTPTRVDQDLFLPNPSSPDRKTLISNPDFESEVLVAYELGYRIKPFEPLLIDVATYYNDYTNLRSVEPVRPPARSPVMFENKVEGATYGGAISLKWRIADWWRVDGGVSYIQEHLHPTADSLDISNGASEGNDPDWTFVAHSMLDLPWHLRFDTVLRYVDDLPNPPTPSYFTADVRIAWSPNKNLELAIVGRDLWDKEHPEFSSPPTHEVGRSVFATIKWIY